MSADLTMAAAARFRELSDLVVALPGPVAFGIVSNLVREIAENSRILLAPKQDAVRWVAVAPRASSLLIELLD